MSVIVHRYEQHSEEFGYKDADNFCTRCQNRENLHSHHDPDIGALVDREEDDTGSAEQKHAECQELGFIVGVRQTPGPESDRQAY